MSTNMDSDRTLWQRAAQRLPADEGASLNALDPLLLAAWLDGRATPEETERVEATLAANPALLDEAAELRALRAEDAADAPASVLERAAALVPAQEKPGRVFLLPRAGWQAVAAAVAVLVTAPAAYRMGLFTGRRPARAAVPAEVRALFTQDTGENIASVLRPPNTAPKGGRRS